MLAFKYRFHGHGSLRYVYSHGEAVRSRLMTLKYSTHPKRKNPRIAVVISKKVIKRAVGRNRVRRRVYEVMRLELPRIKPNQDLVLIMFSGDILNLPSEELTQTIRQMLESANVYKD